ncbi:MAG: hypothetical protein B6U87_02680 [Candidatus Aenigmarchaeota archaeon ex4484_52]|nr:MAG: hypothetical protein B6U87_02680 [Candidatus Aenigmarchaeota archaeon ex4484_52]
MAYEKENNKDEVKFEVVKSQEIDFGTRGDFIEVARKKAISKENENEFISLSRGYKLEDQKRFRKGKNLSFPVDKKIVEQLIQGLTNLISE